jgi:hypothetical protein
MAAGGDTFIHDMLSHCGLTNIFESINRYPEISTSKYSVNKTQQLISNNSSTVNNPPSTVNSHPSSARLILTDNCQLLLLSSEPYPFKQKHLDELKALLPFAKIMLVDGEMFSWYGSRLLYSAQYFKKLIQQIQQ